jgi:hypothetical protein
MADKLCLQEAYVNVTIVRSTSSDRQALNRAQDFRREIRDAGDAQRLTFGQRIVDPEAPWLRNADDVNRLVRHLPLPLQKKPNRMMLDAESTVEIWNRDL